jgi:Periplasmic protease
VLVVFLSQQAWGQSNSHDSLAFFDKKLTVSAMREDLRLFRDIREKANSGLYRYRSQQQIDSIYQWAFHQTSKPLSVTEFNKIILVLTDFEGSCHNYTEVPEELLDYLNRQKAFFPYALKYIEGKIVFNNDYAPIPVGARILSINGRDDKTLMQSFYKYITTDGYAITEKLSGSVDKSFGIRYLLEYGLTDSFTIRFSPPYSSEIKTLTVAAVYKSERESNLALRHSAPVDSVTDYSVEPMYSFKMLNPSTGLLHIRIFAMAASAEDPAFAVYVRFIDSVFNVLHSHSVKNLILDIRGNPGGSDPTFEQPMMYLTDQSFRENTTAYIMFDSIPYEEYFFGVTTSHKMGEVEKVEGKKFLYDRFPRLVNGKNHQHEKHNPVYNPKKPAFEGRLYLLINENVASAASHLASLVKGYARNATVVGVETGGGYYGHNGHVPFVYQLPNSGIKTKFSIVYVVQDAPVKPDQPEGRGIIPHHEVWQSFDDFMKNRDTQMEYVMKLINGSR